MKGISLVKWLILILVISGFVVGGFFISRKIVDSSLIKLDNVIQLKRLGVSFKYPSSWGAFSFDEKDGRTGREFAITFNNEKEAPLIGGTSQNFIKYRDIRLTDAYGLDFKNCKIQFSFGGINDMPPSADPGVKCAEKVTTNTMTTYYLRVSSKYDDSKQLIFHPNQLIGIVPLDKTWPYGVVIIVINNDGKNMSTVKLAEREALMKRFLGSFEKIPEKVADLPNPSLIIPFLMPPSISDFPIPPPPFPLSPLSSMLEEGALHREDNALHEKLKKFEDERKSQEEIWRRELETGRGILYQNKKRGIYLEFPSDTLYVASKNVDDFLRESFNVVFCINAPKNEKYCNLNADGEVVVRDYQLMIDPKNSIPVDKNFMHELCKVHICRENNAVGEVVKIGERLFFKKEPQTYYLIDGAMLYEIIFDYRNSGGNLPVRMISSMLTNFKPQQDRNPPPPPPSSPF